MFGSRRFESVLAALRAENSDLRAQLRQERESWSTERQTLVDRILALSAPGALREVRRVLPATPEPKVGGHAAPRRLNYPGYAPYLRPPSPASPPSTPGSLPLTDVQKADVIAQAEPDA